jgi:hypothetical protein
MIEAQSVTEACEMILEGLKYLRQGSVESDELINWLYTPDSRIFNYLEKLRSFLALENPTKKERSDAGYLLEKILLLAFKGLAGSPDIKNCQSASHQYDLLISGDNQAWEILCTQLYLSNTQPLQNHRGIIAEAKATEGVVSVAQFSRLCSIMTLDLCNTVGLGVFFSLEGASGFPKRGDTRVLCMKYARFTQAIFHAKTGKNIVVLDKEDILELDKNGALIRLLTRKIRELEENTGLATASVSEPTICDLPGYLRDL